MDPLTVTAALGAVVGFGSAWQMRRRVRRVEDRLRHLTDELHAERHAAGHDPLTGLPNRRTFHTLGTAMLAAPGDGRLTAVVLDLDDFKLVNDRFGHAAGDEVLVTVARRFAAHARAHSASGLVARLGGDEFAGLLHGDCGDEGWLRVAAHRLANTLAAPMQITGVRIRVTASVGLAPVPYGAPLSEALRQADAEMYRAKARRRRDERHRGAGGTRHPAHERHWIPARDPETPAWPASPEGRTRPTNQHRPPATPPAAVRQLVDTSTTQSPDLGGS